MEAATATKGNKETLKGEQSKGMIKETHHAMGGWLIVKRMKRFCQVHMDIIDIFTKKVRKVDADLRSGRAWARMRLKIPKQGIKRQKAGLK